MMSHLVSFPSWETHPSIIFSHLGFTFSSAAQNCNAQGTQRVKLCRSLVQTNKQMRDIYNYYKVRPPVLSAHPSVLSISPLCPECGQRRILKWDESNKEIRFARKNQPFNGNGKRRTRTAQNCRFNSYELSLLNWKDPAQCHFLIALTLEKVRPFTGTSWPDDFFEMRNISNEYKHISQKFLIASK